MAMEINNQQDILRALDTDPAFREAVRRHLLTDDLINLPEQFAAFVTSSRRSTKASGTTCGALPPMSATSRATSRRARRLGPP